MPAGQAYATPGSMICLHCHTASSNEVSSLPVRYSLRRSGLAGNQRPVRQGRPHEQKH